MKTVADKSNMANKNGQANYDVLNEAYDLMIESEEAYKQLVREIWQIKADNQIMRKYVGIWIGFWGNCGVLLINCI